MSIKISEIDELFKSVFTEGRFLTYKNVYEKHDNYYNLIISIHSLLLEETFVIHTKFIFKTNLEKTEINGNYFTYLYDINCNYHKELFKSVNELEYKLKRIIKTNNFGRDLQLLSDFVESPALLLNHYLKTSDRQDYTIFDVIYEPKFKITKCEDLRFDFVISVNNTYDVKLNIKKVKLDETNEYDFSFSFLDEILNKKSDVLKNIHFTIGEGLVKILDKKLK
jgi:hypothetical protein